MRVKCIYMSTPRSCICVCEVVSANTSVESRHVNALYIYICSFIFVETYNICSFIFVETTCSCQVDRSWSLHTQMESTCTLHIHMQFHICGDDLCYLGRRLVYIWGDCLPIFGESILGDYLPVFGESILGRLFGETTCPWSLDM